MSTRVHPTAVIEPGAELDSGVSVGPYCVVRAGARIGRDTVLHNHVTVFGGTAMGHENVVYPYAVLGAEPQDLKYEGEPSLLVIGDRNKIREHATLHRGTRLGGGRTVVGSGCLFMVGCHIAHDCVIEDEVVIANASMLGGHCLVEYGATLAGGVGVHHYTTIGTLSFVGGMARCSRDVPPYLMVEGTPAVPRKVNTTALARRRWPADEVETLREAFRVIYRNEEAGVTAGLGEVRAMMAQSAAVMKLCDFLERTQMGVYGRYRETLRGDSRGGG